MYANPPPVQAPNPEHATPTTTLAAILQLEVQFLERHESSAERALEDIIKRCLVKDREKKYQTIALVTQDVENVQRLLAPTGRRMKLAPVLAVTVALVGGVAAWRLIADRSVAELLLVPAPVTMYEGDEIQPSLSPEGDRVAFSCNGPKQDNFDIYAKLLDSGTPLRLTTDAADDSSPAWSPDGQSIAFMRGRAEQAGAVLVLPVLGGAERKVTDIRIPPAFFPGRALAWSPDGKWLVCGSCTEDGTLLLISAETGVSRGTDARRRVSRIGRRHQPRLFR